MLRSLEQLDETRFRPQVFCSEIPRPPINSTIPIYRVDIATNLRNDKGPQFWFCNHWRMMPTLKHLKNVGVCCNKYQLVDCPAYLNVHDRHNFLRIITAYKSEFKIITSCEKYRNDLTELGCIVDEDIIQDYNPKDLTTFIEKELSHG